MISFTEDHVAEGVERHVRTLPKKPGYILSVLPEQNKTIYSGVKKALDVKLGIPNQCTLFNKFTKQKFDKFDLQMYALMSMKTCIKLGGVNHMLDPSSNSLLVKNNLPALVLGADVTHPTGTNEGQGVSIASVVGSVDQYFNTFPGSISLQEGRVEVIGEMAKMVFERCVAYHKKMQKFPNEVLFYRDGVSYGQFDIILKEEVPKVKEALKQIGLKYKLPNYKPKLTFLVIIKRHNTRFFPLEKNAKNSAGKLVAVESQENAMPGSVIEKGVTSVKYFDFFLQSQQALQGTAIPGHYFVLYDELNYKPDNIQALTYNLCNLFSRATKSVRVVPPAYYADLLCERGTCYIHGVVPRRGETHLEAATKSLGAGINQAVASTMVYI
ncbi:unnamed protein product [Ambrosiozyma monospora]|uniref:Unnamed protein product n=1 Tax=Ambrosiozyma monospora TaxID=43982 RepID=A0A9W6SVZ4_AMBMO|nr:unnamed protein product [Ambrosiozyma monospora]